MYIYLKTRLPVDDGVVRAAKTSFFNKKINYWTIFI